MAEYLVAPECPCGHRTVRLRFDPDDHIGVIICDDCGEKLMVVSVLANKNLKTIKDPMAPQLTEDTYYRLDEAGRLPPAVEGE